jgi:hypothetical protein
MRDGPFHAHSFIGFYVGCITIHEILPSKAIVMAQGEGLNKDSASVRFSSVNDDLRPVKTKD